MTVVELFPRAPEPEPEETRAPIEAPTKPRSSVKSRRRRRAVSATAAALEVLAQAGGGGGPVAVLARAAERRPADSFWAVWLSQQEFLRNRSLRLLRGRRADAEEALGNAMIRAAQAFERQPVRDPRRWLLRILHNACMDQHRLSANSADLGPEEDTTLEPLWTTPARSPETLLFEAERVEAWRRAFSALPPTLTTPLRLHLDDWSDDAIALHLGISRELVRKRRQLAKERLKSLLRDS